MDKYLHAGVSALVNTTRKLSLPWFFGHSGASILAGFFLLKDNDLDVEVSRAITKYLDQTISADPVIFELSSLNNSLVSVDELLSAISICVNSHSTTGHGVIFGTLALRALVQEPKLLTRQVSEGLVTLLRQCLEDVPNRHYGINNYQSSEVDYSGCKSFSSVKEAAEYSLTVHETVYPDQTIGETFYFLAGDLLHSVTYAHALLELEALGYGEIAHQGLGPLSRHIFLSSRLHKDLYPLVAKRVFDPKQLSFWQRPLAEPHNIKLAYSSMALIANYSPQEKDKVFRNLSKYWAMYH
ncbi:hypothetical protein [Oceanicoccus sp. KOV_DT_Chl]|uniref:hypothetical protein n=1 Tax=Oceanicoccus sp. KOV_DT_Chl TaxID=1904639 RepID=UPI000C7D993E|nr:hypothetical protein [Oceanicoccus sp. KOV_DT_Chl]